MATDVPAAHAEVRIGLAAPLTGPYAWGGAGTERGAEAAVADLNARGGVLGEQIELITADDYCDGAQAVAAANKLVAAGVVAVFGHQCSGAAIPTSKTYADAGILMISNGARNPLRSPSPSQQRPRSDIERGRAGLSRIRRARSAPLVSGLTEALLGKCVS
jgi:ABC-type branched-subunit amino acid transport system substrate-binding protein